MAKSSSNKTLTNKDKTTYKIAVFSGKGGVGKSTVSAIAQRRIF